MINYMDGSSAEARIRRESIRDRKEILAPAYFVSVYHETTDEAVSGIDMNGLKVGIRNQQPEFARQRTKNQMLDDLRPEELVAKNVSRDCIYAFPSLQHAGWLPGASRRHVHDLDKNLRFKYEVIEEYSPEQSKVLRETYGVTSVEDYIALSQNKEYLRKLYPGEVLEMKIDPKTHFVGDAEYIDRISELTSRGWSLEDAVLEQAEDYWNSMITLEDFLKWYKFAQDTEDGTIKDKDQFKDEYVFSGYFHALNGAPDTFPTSYHLPEVLIPEGVPQDKIKIFQ